MLVNEYMVRHPIMIEGHRRVLDAQRIMAENKIRHLPVVKEGKQLVGLLTRQRMAIPPERLGSLDVWEITSLLADLTVDKVMVKGNELQTIGPQATLEEAARLMIKHKIGSLPVVEEGVVVGIITEIDLLIELQNLLGANEEGWRVTMRVPNKDGEFTRLSKTISDQGWSIMSLGSVRSPKSADFWDIVIKVSGCDKAALEAVLAGIEGQQLMDLRATRHFAVS